VTLLPRKAGASTSYWVTALLTSLVWGYAHPAHAGLALPTVQPAVVRQSVQRQSSNGIGAAEAQLRLQVQAGIEVHELLLQPNLTLNPWPAAQISGVTAYEGALPNLLGSWARVTRIGSRWVGMWFDGARYFAIDNASELAFANEAAAALPADTPVVFRAADAILDGVLFENDTLAFDAIAEDPLVASAVLPTRRVTVALVADAELVAQDGANAAANMLARLNIVDGIFANQVGVRVQSASVTLLTALDQPFSGTLASTLLEQLRDFRSGSATQQGAGISHYMTGRNLDGQTVGIAYIDSLCNNRFSASISEARNSANFDALIAAHELGHVFGAPHDGDSAAACAATATTFVMAPQLNGSSAFSACSLEQIAPVVARAQCLAPVDAADAALGAALTANLAQNQATDLPVTVRSEGTIAVQNVVLTADFLGSVNATAASFAGGTCTITGGQQVRCDIGTLAPNDTRNIQLALVGSTVGSSRANLQLTAGNDGLADNNRASVLLQVAPGADISAAATAAPLDLLVGAATTATVTVRNLGLVAATDTQLTVEIPAGLSLTAVSANNLGCTLSAAAVSCTPSPLAADAVATVTLSLQAAAIGNATLNVAARSSRVDPQSTNNQVALTFSVNSPPPPPPAPTPTNSGGGGHLGIEILLLAGLLRRVRLLRLRRLEIAA
jgi:hypothetical protein